MFYFGAKMGTFMCILLVFSCLVIRTFSFNLDTVNYVLQSGQKGSMFGFSVTTHNDRGQTW